jgi:hypothetical protein
MRKLLLAAAGIFSLLTTQAQDSTTVYHHTDSASRSYLLYNYTSVAINNVFNENFRADANNRINVDFDYQANSDAVPALFVYKTLFKGNISKELKDRTDKNITTRLKFEDYMKTGATYRRYFKKWDGTVILGWHHRESRLITGTKDAYRMVFYGNARFEGDTADFTNFNFQNHVFNQLTLGFSKVVDYGKYQMQFGVTASFLQGINNQYIKTGTSWIYTAPDADSIVFNYDLNFNTAREGAVAFTQLNGAGASADFNIAFMNKDKWKISLDLMDVGSMTFRKTPVNYFGAKNVVFKGITIPNLLEFSSQTFDTLNVDSAVRSNLPVKTTNKYSVFMPFSAQLVFSKPLLHNRLVLNIGVLYRHLPKYYAYGFVKVNYFLKPDMVISASAGAGAYARFNLGFEFSKSWKYFDLTIGSNNLLGLVIPTHMPGSSIYLRMASSF